MNKDSWNKHFKENYYPYLDVNKNIKGLKDNIWKRAAGFEKIFVELLKIKDSDFQILETGTARTGAWSDGASSLLFTDFAEFFGGNVRSVDINLKSVEKARKLIKSNKFQVSHNDSIEYLMNMPDKDKVDLFYLDSYDVIWNNDYPSASHHFNEFKVIEPFLENCLVAVDDNTEFLSNNQRTGKGRLIYEYLLEKKKLPIYDDYILIYKF